MSLRKNGGFILNDDGEILPVIENFYKYCAERRLMGVKCEKCGTIMCPPRAICRNCLSDKYAWLELRGRGRLVTYTIIYFPPTQFQLLAPYPVGISKLDEGPHVPGIIKNVKLEEIKIGMQLCLDYEPTPPKEWPRWARYYFKPT